MHDLGGMHGFGAVEVETDEPVFHHGWERRAFRLTLASMLSERFPPGRFRHSIERMEPAWYLASPYYEHWLTATATWAVETGVVTREELDARLGASFPLASRVRAPVLQDPGTSVTEHLFSVGDAVQVRDWHPVGHTRAPRYVRGKRGTVVRLDGVFSVPDVACHCDLKRREPTYSIRFEAGELWGEPGDAVHVDLWQCYLEPAAGA